MPAKEGEVVGGDGRGETGHHLGDQVIGIARGLVVIADGNRGHLRGLRKANHAQRKERENQGSPQHFPGCLFANPSPPREKIESASAEADSMTDFPF